VLERLPGARRGLTLRLDRQPRRIAAFRQLPDFGGERLGLPAKVGNLLRVEFDLLLAAADVELARVRGLASFGRARLGAREPEADGLQCGFQLGDVRGRRGFACARRLELLLSGFDVARERVVLARELHLLPAPQLLAQPLVAPGPRGLPAKRAALL